MEKLCNISTQQTEATKLLDLSYCHICFRDSEFKNSQSKNPEWTGKNYCGGKNQW